MTANERIQIKRFVDDGVALLGTCNAAPGGVTFCFTERTGGVSLPPFASLNLGTKGGDDPDRVKANRRRVMKALGAPELADTLIVPNQVHGDEVALITSTGLRPACLETGADAVVCTAANQAVMLLFADCTPVVLVAPGGFAVAHSGWRGTLAGIAGKTARLLARACGCATSEVQAFIGPHISGESYEVSQELLDRFVQRFGDIACWGPRHLDMSACVRASLEEAGVVPDMVNDTCLCTAKLTDRFFSHRTEHGMTGRHAAIAFMRA